MIDENSIPLKMAEMTTQDEIVAQLGTFGTFFSKPIILFCIFIVSWYLMYVAFNYAKKGSLEKGLKIIFPTLLGSLSLVYLWVSINDLTTLIYNKKIDTLKSEISSMKQEALNKELREDELTKAQNFYFKAYGQYSSNISELISKGFLRANFDTALESCNDFGFALSTKGKCEPITSDIRRFVEELDIKKGITQDFSKDVRDMIWRTQKEQRINLKKLVIKVFKDQDMAYYNANKDELDQVAEDIINYSFSYLNVNFKILSIERKDDYTYVLIDTKNSGFTSEQLTQYKNDTKSAAEKHNVIVLFND